MLFDSKNQLTILMSAPSRKLSLEIYESHFYCFKQQAMFEAIEMKFEHYITRFQSTVYKLNVTVSGVICYVRSYCIVIETSN